MDPITERFVKGLDPGHRDEGAHSLYHRAVNMTNAVLVVDANVDASSLVAACFEKRYPVAVDRVRHDPSVPRIEASSREIVGEYAIRNFLASLPA